MSQSHKQMFRTDNVAVVIIHVLIWAYEWNIITCNNYRKPSFNAGLANADSIICVKINVNNYFPKAEN